MVFSFVIIFDKKKKWNMWLFSSCFTVKSIYKAPNHDQSVSKGFTVHTTYYTFFFEFYERVHYTLCGVPTINGGSYVCIYVTVWFRRVSCNNV